MHNVTRYDWRFRQDKTRPQQPIHFKERPGVTTPPEVLQAFGIAKDGTVSWTTDLEQVRDRLRALFVIKDSGVWEWGSQALLEIEFTHFALPPTKAQIGKRLEAEGVDIASVLSVLKCYVGYTDPSELKDKTIKAIAAFEAIANAADGQ